jgi:asparagine synthase (glutamine-hydrolysing)
MCGIVGYFNLNGHPVDPGEQWLSAMCHSILHRGPDEEGKIVVGPAALGMTRLSIIDLATGQQPVFNEDKTICIVFNGEIYNFHDLQKLVREKGHTLATNSDTECIVHLYEEYGVDCLKHLEGMFAFALWDSNRRRLLIARDRMGEKPLHYGVFDGLLVFGSELKGILAHPQASAKRELDIEGLQKYLALEYVPAPSSIFKGIHKLPPSHYLLVENGQINTGCYWEPKIDDRIGSEQDAVDALMERLERSIRLRLIADVPLGVFLSGGIDSSTIAALASKQVSEPLKTFSIGFTDKSFDESQHAKLVADHLGTDHHVAWFTPDLGYDTLMELWNYLDEPLADASIVPTYFLSKMTRQHVKVALAGEGGDELFGGYPTYQAHRLAHLWSSMPSVLRRGLLEPAIRGLPVSHNNLSFDYKAKRFIKAAQEPAITRHFQWMGSIPLSEQAHMLRSGLSTLTREEQLYQGHFRTAGMNTKSDVVAAIMELDLNTYLPDDLLVKSDRASMAASLEVRLPFLAYPLVEFALSLPTSLKVKGLKTKYLLKKAVRSYLPPSILQRPKKGFGIPVAKWLRQDFKPLVDELLSPSFIQRQDLFDYGYIDRLLQEHNSCRVDRRKELWTLFMFQIWWRKFFAGGQL